MTASKKAQTRQVKGKAKAAAGRAVGNEHTTAEGHAEKPKGGAREANERAKGAFKR
ncbi:CsbD family protein [Streptomyces broussonetiae]|uniref:CsbD family protein n=1 Tax=Streptomyces broussonetiae TaxID=2686304 RepID=UPI0035DE490D